MAQVINRLKANRPAALNLHSKSIDHIPDSKSSPLTHVFGKHNSSPHKSRPTRILCLHGKGTSAKVLETQMKPLLKKLGSRVECVFLNGPVLSDPYHGIDRYFSGPYFSWYPSPTRQSLTEALDFILDQIDSLGPFDGVFGFSQGAAMAAMLCMDYPHMFKFAAFFCGGRPYDRDTLQRVSLERGTGDFVTRTITTSSSTSSASSPTSSGSSTPRSKFGEVKFSSSFLHSNASSEDNIFDFATSELDMNASRRPSLRPTALITVPTVHLIGKQDAHAGEGRMLKELCDQTSAVLVEHDGGHVMPRTSAPVGELFNAVDAVIKKGLSQSS
ncbi:hypothetical protein OC846_002975 [Tilletia horrida]|uniref:Serine hydrolase domain-containing protein n=1 Tax=Tilletia horrida TaxID=155126 RepID=A0AAN6GR78_9BASI|nr:hypothetical protein OC846_002975 [Tilletia horrida]